MLEVGTLLDGKYKILNKVGQGGMSVVYLAMNERANKQWAVKEVRKDGVLDFESVKQGLVAETDILKKLSHPHLPSIIDVIDTADSFIIIMDYVQGNSLDKALKEFGAQSQEDVIEWAKQLCDVLGYLHTRQPSIIYRDMKPANVMLKPDGSISLIDFGTAREHKAAKLEDTTCLGTRGYAAPEQYGGMGQTDARTDIYCLGATIYHLVTGMNPSEPPYEIRPIRQIDPTLSGGLEKIILKCTQNDPADRYQSCAELMYALEHYNEIDDAYKKQQKNKLALFVTSAALTVACAATSIFGYFSAESAKQANNSQLMENADRGDSPEEIVEIYNAVNENHLLANADSCDSREEIVENYYEVIEIDPTRTEAYLGTDENKGLIDYLIDDGKLDQTDSNTILQLRNGVNTLAKNGDAGQFYPMEQLKAANDEGYKDVCYKIGEAYLYYYKDSKHINKYEKASSWFKESVDAYPVASFYCEIYECLKNIDKYTHAGQTGNLSEEYKTLWNKMVSLEEETRSLEDDLKMHVWNEIVDMISEYSNEFCQVTSKSQINKLLGNISSQAAGVKNTFLEESLATLQENIDVTLTKISTVSK